MPVAAGREKLKVLIRRSAIQKRVRQVAHQITKDFKGERVHLVGVLKGACIFLSDLVRELNIAQTAVCLQFSDDAAVYGVEVKFWHDNEFLDLRRADYCFSIARIGVFRKDMPRDQMS